MKDKDILNTDIYELKYRLHKDIYHLYNRIISSWYHKKRLNSLSCSIYLLEESLSYYSFQDISLEGLVKIKNALTDLYGK